MSGRAAQACTAADCPHLQPCPDHHRKPWQDSRRRSSLSGSAQQRRARAVILQHDGICHVCGTGGATIADHVEPLGEGGPDTIENMRPIHDTCHKAKTAGEAARARNR